MFKPHLRFSFPGMLVLTVVVLATPARGQDNGMALITEPRPDGAAFSKGSMSLQFGIEPWLTFTSFDGGFVSLKRHWSDRSALRLGLDLSLESTRDERDLSYFQEDSLASRRTSDMDVDQRDVGIRLTYQYYPNPAARPAFYLGFGPALSVYRRDREGSETALDYTYRIDEETRGWSAGSRCYLGAEYLVTRGFSLHGEYQFFAGYRSSRSEMASRRLDEQRTEITKGENKGWEIENRAAAIGLSVYF